MRIAHVTLDGGFPRYGIGLAVLSLASAQARMGHEIVLCVRAENARTEEPPPPGLRIIGLVRRSGLLGGRRAYRRQVLDAISPGVDVVHVHSLVRMAHWLLPSGTRRAAPLVVTAHASDELGSTASPAGAATPARARRHTAQARAVLAGAHAIVVPSRFMERLVRRVAVREGIHVIGHGPTDERPVPRKASSRFVVTALARFVPVKGMSLLLDAFHAAFGADDSTRLVLAGDGPERDALEARARALGLGDHVAFPGYVTGDARAALLAGTDLVAVPTHGDYETFGLAALDGLAAGCAVRVAAGGALPERVDLGGVVAAQSVEAWTRALQACRLDVRGREAAALGAASVLGENSWSRAVAAHETAYLAARAACGS